MSKPLLHQTSDGACGTNPRTVDLDGNDYVQVRADDPRLTLRAGSAPDPVAAEGLALLDAITAEPMAIDKWQARREIFYAWASDYLRPILAAAAGES